jgi:putative RNA 2'-phosphotransferase
MDRDLVRISRFLSMILRHRPARVGLRLDEAGWVEVDALLEAMRTHGMPVDRPTLERVVAENDKQRFAFSADGRRIRANQGHTIHVDLGLEPQTPPELLYHGTSQGAAAAILREGLRRGKRHAVHLSLDPETAYRVGQRHGKPSVLVIAAGRMAADGRVFTCSENGVWLTEYVPPEYISFHSGAKPEEPAPKSQVPGKISGEGDLLAFLDGHAIPYTRIAHPAVFTCEEAARYRSEMPGLESKNLLLQDEQQALYLVMTSCQKRLNFRALQDTLGVERLRFASHDLLWKSLQLIPGSVTVLGLVNDPEHRVALLVDAEYWPAPAYLCHPLVNTATLVLEHEALMRFLSITGHEPRLVDMLRPAEA